MTHSNGRGNSLAFSAGRFACGLDRRQLRHILTRDSNCRRDSRILSAGAGPVRLAGTVAAMQVVLAVAVGFIVAAVDGVIVGAQADDEQEVEDGGD